ncbi:MAG: hypothetical protein AB1921_07285 [Thermodesulfobacteriota bacterium]
MAQAPSEETGRALGGSLAALGASALPAVLCAVLAFVLPPLYDESYLVDPVYAHLMEGTAYPGVPYPVHLYVFFEILLRAFFLLVTPGLGHAYLLFRLANIALYLASAVFFYRGLRLFSNSRTALLGTFFLAWSPIGVLSVMMVKTEGLQLALITGGLWLCGRIALGRGRKSDYLMAGLLSGALCLVKYDPLLVLSFLAAAFMAKREKPGERAPVAGAFRQTLADRKVWLGLVAYLACVALLVSTRITPTSHELSLVEMTPYFNPHPSILRSVGEGFAFPYGRFSYPLLVFLPLFAGIAVYGAGLAGVVFRSAPASFFIPWGAFAATYLCSLLALTLTRQPWAFTPALPFLAAMAAFFFGSPSRGRTGSFLKKALLVPAVLLTLYQAALFPVMGYGLSSVIIKTAETRHVEDPDGDLLVLFTNEKTSRSQVDAARLRQDVAERKPAFLLVLSAYGNDFCRHAGKPAYADACAFFQDLAGGRAGYRLLWEEEVFYPLAFVFSRDPGLRLVFDLYREEGPAGREPEEKNGVRLWTSAGLPEEAAGRVVESFS